MATLPTRYYVQTSQSESIYGPPRGWVAQQVTFNRETAEGLVSTFERASVFEHGDEVNQVTIARIVTDDELRAEGEDALVAAEVQTRVQFWLRLAEWAAPLVDPDNP